MTAITERPTDDLPPPPPGAYSENLVQPFRTFLLLSGFSQDTARSYGARVITWSRHLAAKGIDLLTVEPDQFHAEIAAKLGRFTNSTVRNDVACLKQFFRFAIAKRLREPPNPCDGLVIKKPKPVPQKPFSESELVRLLDACTSERDRALLLFLIGTGARISEAIHVRAEDIDWTERTVVLHGKGAKERRVAPGAAALEAVKKLGVIHGPIWLTKYSEPMDRERARKEIIRIGLRANVPGTHAHRFRTTFANLYLDKGGDLLELQVLMGHSQIADTAHYARYNTSRRALDRQERMALSTHMAEKAAERLTSSQRYAHGSSVTQKHITDFIGALCVTAATRKVRVTELFAQYESWCRFHRVPPLKARQFSAEVANLFERKQDHEPATHKSYWYFLGLDLKSAIL